MAAQKPTNEVDGLCRFCGKSPTKVIFLPPPITMYACRSCIKIIAALEAEPASALKAKIDSMEGFVLIERDNRAYMGKPIEKGEWLSRKQVIDLIDAAQGEGGTA